MNSFKYLVNVQPSKYPKTYPPPSPFVQRNTLEKELQRLGLNIVLGNPLKGGFASQVYEAQLDGNSVVVKHTEDLLPFDPTECLISKRLHDIDTRILKKLSLSTIRVPKVLYYFPKISTTIMEDLRLDGYVLLDDQIRDKKLSLNSAVHIGKKLAEFELLLQKLKFFQENESAQSNIYERGFELRFAYPNNQKQYLELEREYIKHNTYLLWPDGHPKNAFVNEQGEVAFIDFGRSHFADQRYMLPNFLSHIALFSLAGYIPNKIAHEYIDLSVTEYKKQLPIDEKIFCQYFAMEVLHRANGKWMQGIDLRTQKLVLYEFGLTVFDEKIDTINSLLRLL